MDLETAVEAVATANVSDESRRTGLVTIQKLLSNLVTSPSEEKFRQVKKSNPAIQQKLFPECFGILLAAGFFDSGELFLYRKDCGSELHEALDVVNSLLLSMGSSPAASSSSTASYPAKLSPAQEKKLLQEKQLDKQRSAAAKSQASAQDQLAELRRQRAGRYQEEQDTALAQHLSGLGADEPFDAISALNVSRGATHSFITCSQCGCSLRYNSATRAQAVLCPCGMLLQPIHLRGQTFNRRALSDLPVEPGEPVDQDNRPRQTRGPFITVQGPDGPTRMPLHSVLSMVRQHQDRQQVGADGATIAALPTRTFEGGGDSMKDEDRRCQICIEDFNEGDELRTLPCFHLFHAHCVDQWLKVNSICPTCRHKVS